MCNFHFVFCALKRKTSPFCVVGALFAATVFLLTSAVLLGKAKAKTARNVPSGRDLLHRSPRLVR